MNGSQGLMLVTTMTREQWMNDAIEQLRPIFARYGYEVPAGVKASCSFPGGGSARKRIGECWSTEASNAGVNEIFVSPVLDDAFAVIDTLTHELMHAVDNNKHGHKRAFRVMGERIGMIGKPTVMHAGDFLATELRAIIAKIGQYPHRELNLSSRKKQETRMLKFACNECDMVFRASNKQMVSVCMCPACGAEDYTIGG